MNRQGADDTQPRALVDQQIRFGEGRNSGGGLP
jgi:hypothetical protein